MPVVIISYMGYSPPKCTCHGNQSHSSKYMILLECQHAQSHVSSPHQLPHTCLSQMLEKHRFQNKSFLFLKIHYQVSVNILDYPPSRIAGSFFSEQSWVSLRDELLDHSPRQFFEKSSLKFISQSFSLFFSFSCHALTPTI